MCSPSELPGASSPPQPADTAGQQLNGNLLGHHLQRLLRSLPGDSRPFLDRTEPGPGKGTQQHLSTVRAQVVLPQRCARCNANSSTRSNLLILHDDLRG